MLWQGGYEECNQILAQDIMNRVTQNKYNSAAYQEAFVEAFFDRRACEAWNEFQNSDTEAHERGTKIEVAASYAGIGRKLGVDLTKKDSVSREQFEKAFYSYTQERRGSKSRQKSSSQSLVNTYASYVRDPGTVSAGKDGVTKTKETNLYAFASRDSTQAYVNVMRVLDH